MKLLAIESSTSQCSVALFDGIRMHERSVNAVGLHSSAMFAQIQDVLASAEVDLSALDGVLISAGPGSYTGLRIAASAVKGLLFQRETPFFAVNTLASFAASLDLDTIRNPGTAESAASNANPHIHAIIDARRVHLYAQSFTLRGEQLQADSEPEIVEIASFYERLRAGDVIVGTGLQRLDPEKIAGIQTFPIESTGARGLIQLYTMMQGKKGGNPLIWPCAVEDFEPGYLTTPG